MTSDLAAIDDPASAEVSALGPSNRTEAEDKWVKQDVTNAKLSNGLFVRLIAKERRFTNVDFKYSIFDTCYLRNCVFDSCDFTGCRFIGTNLVGSSFTGSKFDYATFERTHVDDDILGTSCPGPENLKLKFARTLRMNFQQVGNVRAANQAIKIELEATDIHLRKAWGSNEAYYRKKYVGSKRFRAFLEWIEFKILDYIWGNGESPLKLVRAVLVVFGIMTMVDVFRFRDPLALVSYGNAFVQMPQVFLGTLSPAHYGAGYLSAIIFIRLVAFAFFMSIIIKRFNRR